MINTAKTLEYGGAATDFRVVDCRHLEEDAEVMNGNWDKVLVFVFPLAGGALLIQF